MPVEHIVLLDVAENAPPYMREALERGVRSLVKIKGVQSVSFGETFTTERAKGFTHAIVVTLDSKEDLAKYAVDALHLKVKKENIAPILNKTSSHGPILAVDIDETGSRGAGGSADRERTFWKFTAFGALALAGALIATRNSS